MADVTRIDAAGLVAFDVHVHIEHTEETTATDAASAKYFGDSGAARDRASIAEYYRSRRMACVVFSVDERLSGRPQVPNDVVAEFAAENADVAIAFASLAAQQACHGAAPLGTSGSALESAASQAFSMSRSTAHARLIDAACAVARHDTPLRGCRR